MSRIIPTIISQYKHFAFRIKSTASSRLFWQQPSHYWRRQNQHMSTPTAESASHAEAEENSTTGVIDRTSSEQVHLEQLRAEHQQAKKQQKHRLEDLDRDTLLELYRQMVLIRRFEEKSAEAYSIGKIGGFCHLYIGQEAVAVGAIAAIRPDDYVLTSYREHAHAITKGMSPDSVMAELFGKATGCSRGKAVRCTCSTRTSIFLADMRSWLDRFLWPPVWPSRPNIKGGIKSPSGFSVRLQSIRLPFINRSTCARFG